MRDIEEVEKRVMTFLAEHRGTYFSPLDLVKKVSYRYPKDNLAPADIKIAALNLVNAGRIKIDQAWTVGISDEAKK